MAMVRATTVALILACLIGCKDAVVITPDPIRGYGASVTVKLGDSSPLQSGYYRIQLPTRDGSSDERFPEIRELDSRVDGEQTLVLSVDESIFASANAIQTRLYVEALCRGRSKTGSRRQSEYHPDQW